MTSFGVQTGRRPIDWAKLAGNGEAEHVLENFTVTMSNENPYAT